MHGVNGTFGVLCVGLFANGSYGAGWNGSDVARASRACSGATAASSCAQLLGVVVIWTVILGVAFAFFKIQDTARRKGGIRSDGGRRDRRLDLPEMGVLAYPEFVLQQVDPAGAPHTPSAI